MIIWWWRRLSDETITLLSELDIAFTVSVPFERFTELKGLIKRVRASAEFAKRLAHTTKGLETAAL